MDLLKFNNTDIRKKYIYLLFQSNNKDIITYLNIINEYKFKSRKTEQDIVLENPKIADSLIKDNYISNIILASDIREFDFCPVSYAIGKTFDIKIAKKYKFKDKLKNKSMLINYTERKNENYIDKYFQSIMFSKDPCNDAFFSEVRESITIYSGNDINTEPLLSKKKNFCGKPDLILKNKSSELFVIKEKYGPLSEKGRSYDSNLLQLSSYLFGLNTFHINHAYLVHWFYSNGENEKIRDCNIIRIDRNTKYKNKVVNIYNSISNLLQKKEMKFTDLNLNKCIKCPRSIFCGHKTGVHDTIYLPYKEEHYGVKDYDIMP